MTVSDGSLEDSQLITVTVSAVNDTPVATTLLSGSTNEGTSVIMQLSGTDVDGDNLTYSLDTDASNGSVVLDGNLATYTPTADFNGDDSFTFSVSDGVLTDTAEVTLTITAVNDTPVLASVSNVSFDEDGSGSTSLSAVDVDGDDLTFSVSGGTSITATLDGSDVSFSAPDNYNGSEDFSISVTDGELTDSQSFTVTVNAVNDAPVANTASATTAEDQSVVVTLSGSDIDGDNLSFSLDSDATNGSVSISGSFATYTPNANYNGSDSFSFSVSDGSLTDAATVSLTVNAVNDAPVLASISDVSFDEDGSGVTSISASDVDGDDLEFSISGGSSISISLSGNDVSLSAPQDYNGSENFTITVTDGGGLTDSQIIMVTINAVNDAPVAQSGLSGTTNEDESVSVLLSGSDVDGDVLTYSISSQTTNGTVEISGSNATYVPNANFNGSDSFTFTVSDGALDATPAASSMDQASLVEQEDSTMPEMIDL